MFGGKRSEKERLGFWRALQLRGGEARKKGGQLSTRLKRQGYQPSPAVRSLGGGGGRESTPAFPQPQRSPIPGRSPRACRACRQGSVEGVRASGAPRKRRSPPQRGYFWLSSCSGSLCGNCTCLAQCGDMTSFLRAMCAEQAPGELPWWLPVGRECVSAARLPPRPPASPPLSLLPSLPPSLCLHCLSPESCIWGRCVPCSVIG